MQLPFRESESHGKLKPKMLNNFLLILGLGLRILQLSRSVTHEIVFIALISGKTKKLCVTVAMTFEEYGWEQKEIQLTVYQNQRHAIKKNDIPSFLCNKK